MVVCFLNVWVPNEKKKMNGMRDKDKGNSTSPFFSQRRWVSVSDENEPVCTVSSQKM